MNTSIWMQAAFVDSEGGNGRGSDTKGKSCFFDGMW